MGALLLKGVQPGTHLGADQRVGITGHLIHHDPMIPRGVRQKILQHLIVAIRNRFGHALHIASIRLHQTAQVLLCRGRYAVVSRTESIIESSRKLPITRAQLARLRIPPDAGH